MSFPRRFVSVSVSAQETHADIAEEIEFNVVP